MGRVRHEKSQSISDWEVNTDWTREHIERNYADSGDVHMPNEALDKHMSMLLAAKNVPEKKMWGGSVNGSDALNGMTELVRLSIDGGDNDECMFIQHEYRAGLELYTPHHIWF